jgi:hypothetical protein
LNPVSLLELSVQPRPILLDVMEVIVSPDGGAGRLENVVALFSLQYAEIAIAL